MARVHNFSAGPAALPTSVLAEIADEMMDYRGCGMSVLEMSHRSSMYQQIIDDAEATLRRLLSIPDNYRVLFLQGGATLQFAGIPMNLMRRGRAGYIVTGNFANKAYKEAAKYGEAVLLASSEDTNFDCIPDMADINACIAAEAAGDGLDYVYICQNNTIFGTMYHELPACGDVPLVADVSSCFLSQPLDVERYGLIYAGAQKNAGAAGVTVVIVRDGLIADGPAFAQTPQYLDLKTQAAKGSMLNTPNTFGIYVCGKVFRWVEQTGGLAAMAERNWAKANLLYDLLENSKLFHGNDPATVFEEVIDLDNAVKVAYEFYKKHPKETLIVVTADHETGGMSLGTGRYELRLKALTNQEQSQDLLSKAITDLRKDSDKASWEEVKALLADKMGFWEELPLTWEQEKMLRDEYETSFVKNKVVFEESLYAKTEPLAAAARKVMSQIAMVGWTGSGHTAGYVPVFAIGAGSDLFVGKMDNTEIPKRIAKAAGYK